MKRKQKETAEQYLERIPSFAKKKSGMEDVRAFLELLGSPGPTERALCAPFCPRP